MDKTEVPTVSAVCRDRHHLTCRGHFATGAPSNVPLVHCDCICHLEAKLVAPGRLGNGEVIL